MFDLTMQRLAADVGLSRQTIYRYFPTVQDIFRALSDDVILDIYSNLPDLPLSDPDYMSAFVDVALSVFCADSEVVRVLVLASAIGRATGDCSSRPGAGPVRGVDRRASQVPPRLWRP